MKVVIIGQGNQTGALVKQVEEKTGETVGIVNINSKDAELLIQKVPIKEVEPIILKPIEIYSPPTQPKRKGYERPYKYHR